MELSQLEQNTSSGNIPMQLSEWVVRDLLSNGFIKHTEVIDVEEAEEELLRLRSWHMKIFPLCRKVEELSERVNNIVPEILEAKIQCYELIEMIDMYVCTFPGDDEKIPKLTVCDRSLTTLHGKSEQFGYRYFYDTSFGASGRNEYIAKNYTPTVI